MGTTSPDITLALPAQIARKGVFRSFQISAVFPQLSVLENVRIALQRQLGTSYHFWKKKTSCETSATASRPLPEFSGSTGLDSPSAQ